jgi:hypothetical protein
LLPYTPIQYGPGEFTENHNNSPGLGFPNAVDDDKMGRGPKYRGGVLQDPTESLEILHVEMVLLAPEAWASRRHGMDGIKEQDQLISEDIHQPTKISKSSPCVTEVAPKITLYST